jgi:hypothetical protein
MESFGLMAILELLSKFGLIGLILFLWWYDQRIRDQQDKVHRKDLAVILERYDKDMREVRGMYERNASLCRDYAEISKDYKDLIILNTQAITRLTDVMAVIKEQMKK